MENTALMQVPAAGMNALAASDAAASMAEVQAQMIIAKTYPRNVVRAVNAIQNAFTRPKLAEAATYVYARGGSNISGPSIRAAEAIAQLYGNITFGFHEVSRGKDFEGVGFSEVMAVAWDLENNTKRALKFQVRHWRDRSNNQGYALKDERDIYELIANQAQRRVRSCILAVIPGDIIDIALEQAATTLKTNLKLTPDAVKDMLKNFLDNFGVTQVQIEKFIQRSIAAIEPAQFINLRQIYANLRDGLATPDNWFEAEEAPEHPEEKPESRKQNVKAAAKASQSSAAKPEEGNPLPVVGTVDSETGEVILNQDKTTITEYTFAYIAGLFKNAQTADDVYLAADLIKHVPEDQQDELRAIFNKHHLLPAD